MALGKMKLIWVLYLNTLLSKVIFKKHKLLLNWPEVSAEVLKKLIQTQKHELKILPKQPSQMYCF